MDNYTEEIEMLKSRYKEYKLRISEFRKKGIDSSIANLMIMNVLPKIQMAEVTSELKDIKKAIDSLDRVNIELNKLQ